MKKLTTNEFIKRAKMVHGERYDYSHVKYNGSLEKVNIRCKLHGEFLQWSSNHLIGRGCRKCNRGPNMSNTDAFVSKSQKTHGNKYDYKNVKYKNNHTKVCIACLTHGDFFQTPNSHLSGHGCQLCANKILSEKKLKSTHDFIKRAKKIHGNKYNYKKSIYMGCMVKMEIKCMKCGVLFLQKPNDHLDGHGCSKCVDRISKPESLFLDYVKVNNRQKYVHGCHVDGIKDNTIYEFLGDYWHGNPFKFKRDDVNPRCKKTFGELYDSTFRRFDFLKSAGYKINYIWETDWNRWVKTPKGKIPLLTY
jgi:hypothetical protein